MPIATAAEGTSMLDNNAMLLTLDMTSLLTHQRFIKHIKTLLQVQVHLLIVARSGGWRYLAAEATEQKGLASFAQEDFDVDANGHVTIATAAVDNTQLQNNKLILQMEMLLKILN